MKDSKLVLTLCSVLALAACGGGSGGGGAPATSGGSSISNGGASFTAPRDAVSTETAESNREITNLSSEIVVASNSSTPVSTVRTPVSTINDGVTYTSFRLDDVKLFTAENLDDTERSYVNLEIDENGKIGAVKMRVGGQDSGRVVRDTTDTTTFAGPIFEYVKEGNDNAIFRVVDTGQDMAALNTLATTNSLTGGHWNRIDERMVFAANGNGLQYSDFGHFNPVYRSKNVNLTTDDEIEQARARTLHRPDPKLDKYRSDEEFNAELTREDYQLFAGGYAISGTEMLDTLTPQNSTRYSGKAVGRVYASFQNNDGIDRTAALHDENWRVPYDRDTNDDQVMDSYSNDAGHDIAKAYSTSHATMTIDNDGKQTLFMPFNTQSDTGDTFYDVTVEKTAGNNPASITFTGAPNDLQYAKNTSPSSETLDFNPGYYGVNDAVEAAGTVRYYTKQIIDPNCSDPEHPDRPDLTREWEFQGAYGMTRD